MNNHTRKDIEEYQCGICGRVFYIDPRERTGLDIEFGCPYGCDSAGDYTSKTHIYENEVV